MRTLCFVLLSAALVAEPLSAQSYAEAEAAAKSAAQQLRALDRADSRLRQWLTRNRDDVDLDGVRLDQVDALLKGWRVYTSLECDIIGTVTGGNAASRATFSSICEKARYAARIRVVNDTIDCLARSSTQARHGTVDGSACLKALTPLRTDTDYEA